MSHDIFKEQLAAFRLHIRHAVYLFLCIQLALTLAVAVFGLILKVSLWMQRPLITISLRARNVSVNF